jgi:hypothetical protein
MDCLDQWCHLDPRDLALAGGVDLRHEQHVRVVEGGHELVPEVAGARVAVGLEDDDDPPIVNLARRSQGRADLGRVVSVVVDHVDAVGLALVFEASLDAEEGVERFGGRGEGHVQLQRHRQGRQRVEHVVASRHLHARGAQALAAAAHREAHAHGLDTDLRRHQVRL